MPHIYAFRIETFPPSYKIGDTFRGVDVRIDEWRRIYHGLRLSHDKSWRWNAMIKDSFFRDYAVHRYLEEEKGRETMKPEDFGAHHPSTEFYLDTEIEDIEEAIQFIRENASKPDSPYRLYSSATLKEEIKKYERTLQLDIRKNQEEVIANFKKAYQTGHNKMLMYATMRFGKTVTALSCAREINASSVLVVSGKADVSDGWKKSVQGIIGFDKFRYFDRNNLSELDFEKEERDNTTAVVFLTLQDLQGNKIKRKHRKLFNDHIWSMVIVDETHFGARAPKYGLSLSTGEVTEEKRDKISKDLNPELLDKELKQLKRKVTLHLSGTPYRILMTNEFKEDEVIACVRYPDIIKARDEWYQNNADASEDGRKIEEWENPYFGFPEMIRFAFNLNRQSLEALKKLEDNGATVRFSELFRTLANRPDAEADKRLKFVHENEVLSFLKTIDGTQDDANVLGFLNNERIKNGKLCRHIVMVLPYCASCDAMVHLINKNKAVFKNLGDYTLINIAGHDSSHSVVDCLKKIRDCEAKSKKTISFTVKRMLTGVTVPEWDTMIYLKESTSPEEYDQAIYRLQNPYIRTYLDKDGTVVKYNMKPQTILVDFDPQRMFRLQERKCLIYSSTRLLRDKQSLKLFIDDELKTSPIISLDHHKLRQLDASDILDAIRRYAETRGIPEEASAIAVDESLLTNTDILDAIAGLNSIDSKQGISQRANKLVGEGDDVDSHTDNDSGHTDRHGSGESSRSHNESEDKSVYKKLASYYSLILYFAFLTRDRVVSLKDIIERIDEGENKRIASNLGLDKKILEIILNQGEPYTLLSLDKSINDTNYSGNRTDLEPLERVDKVFKRCTRLSSSEMVTPAWVAKDMVSHLPDNLFEEDGIVLDIASKQGEFASALYNRYAGRYPGECRTRIYSLCTSGLAYEFTRKTYECLGLDTNNIVNNKTSYDIIAPLLDKTKDTVITIKDIIGKDMKVNAIIGNPPYQETGQNNNKAEAIYPYFYDISERISIINVFISPARFLFNAGLTSKVWNNRMLSDEHINIIRYFHDSDYVFTDTNITGGVAIILRNLTKKYTPVGTFIPDDTLRSLSQHFTSSNLCKLDSIGYGGRSDLKFNNRFLEDFPNTYAHILNHLRSEHPEITELAPNEVYELKSSSFTRTPYAFFDEKPSNVEQYYQILGIEKGKRVWKWVKREYLSPRYPNNNNIGKYKVFISKADGAAGQIGNPIPARIVGKPVIGVPGSSSTASFISLGNFSSYEEAENLSKYVQTKFARALLGILKVTQDITPSKWSYVPMQNFTANSDIDWSMNIAHIDKQLYTKYNLNDDEIAFIETMIESI